MKQLIALIALSGAAALSFAQTAAPAAAPARVIAAAVERQVVVGRRRIGAPVAALVRTIGIFVGHDRASWIHANRRAEPSLYPGPSPFSGRRSG